MLCSLLALPEGNKVSQPPKSLSPNFSDRKAKLVTPDKLHQAFKSKYAVLKGLGPREIGGNHLGWGVFCELLFEFFLLVISKLVVDSLTYLSSCDAANGIFFFALCLHTYRLIYTYLV